MRRITINAYQVALVFKKGKLINVFTEGKYWIGFSCKVQYLDMTEPLQTKMELSILLENDRLRNLLDVVTIDEHELGFEMKNGLFNRVVFPGMIGYWDSPVEYEVIVEDMSDVEVSTNISRKFLKSPEVYAKVQVCNVEPFEKGLLYIDGEYSKMLDAGTYYYWKGEVSVAVTKVDTRIQSLEVTGQEILTKDKAGIRVNFQAQYKVVDEMKAVMETKDFQKQLYVNVQLALRAYASSLTLDELLTRKDEVGKYIVSESIESAALLGVELMSGGIKDIILPGDVKDIMNQVLIAQKKAQANTIMRQEETASTRSLLNTAKLMDQNAMLLKLKEMEYMEKIADKVGEITVNGGTQLMDQLQKVFVK